MFALTGDAPAAASLFAHAATLLGGRDPREIVRSEPAEALHHNSIGQILCTLQALAAASVLHEEIPDRLIVAGYSVGEVAAWGVAGLMSMTETLDVVARRAEAMDAATLPGDGMLFVRGLPRDAIDRLCERRDAEVAIVNPGDAFILGGSRAALNALADDAKAMNAARVVDVPVEVASHTRRLAKASTEFRDSLSHAAVAALPAVGMRLLSGIDAAPIIDVRTGLDKLAAQISQTVQWADCLQACIESEATVILELGPGRALSEMVAGAYHDVATRSLEDFRTLDGIRAWLAVHVDR
jgi:[acyl-carrier-protein] S-malonyltransferase